VSARRDGFRLTVDSFGRRLPAIVLIASVIEVGLVVGSFGPVAALVPIAAVAAIAAAWAWLRMPGVLLAAYLFLPFYKALLGHLSPIDLTLLLGAVNASQVVPIVLTRLPYRGSRLGLTLWVVLGFVVLAGVMWAGQQDLAVNRTVLWWGFILLPTIAAVRVASEARLVNHFIWTAFVIGTIVVILGLPNLFGSARLDIIGENTIQTGEITLIVALLAIVWVARVAPLWIRILAAIAIPITLAESIASGSRGPILAFGAVVLVVLLHRLLTGPRLSRSDLQLAALGLLALVPLGFAISRLPSQSLARFLLLGQALAPGGATGGSIGARVDLFAVAVQMFSARPLLGNGTASFAAYASTHVGLTIYAYPHDDLLQLAAELGIVGAGLFVALVGGALFRQIPDGPVWWSVRCLFLLAFLISMISGDIYGDRLLWGLLVILICAPHATARKDPDLPGFVRNPLLGAP
jgi:hypothetical protein